MESGQISYVPFGERPEPYPPGYAPDPGRWTGRELLRVELDPTADAHVLPGGLPACTPVEADPNTVTARTSQRTRYIPADRLPARRTVLLEHVTDDPGRLAIHGRRLGQDLPATEAGDGWTSTHARLVELPLGGVIVAVETDTTGRRFWRAWRVTPIGPPVLVFRHESEPGDRSHLAHLAALLDEELAGAFDAILARYERSNAAPAHVAQMRQAISHWKFGVHVGRPRKRRQRRNGADRQLAPASRGTMPRMVASAA